MATTTAPPPGVGLVRYARRESQVWRRLWRGSVFSGFVTPLMFLGAMGLGLGELVDERSGGVAGLDYIVFVAPGLLVASAAQNAAAWSLWPVMGGMKWMRVFHAAAATPLRPSDVYGGFIAWQATLTALQAVPFLAVAAILGGVPSPWGVLAIGAAVLCGLAFMAPLVAYTATRDDDSTFPVIMRLIVLPLFLFSGTFFPLDQLPGALRPIAWVSPLWHAVELARGATTGSIGLGAAVLHITVLGAYIAVGWAVGVGTFTRRLTP
jgi:lipooligosaccharide transport system permease protein